MATRRKQLHMNKVSSLALAALALACNAASADGWSDGQNVAKVGISYYQTHSETNGITGIGVPPGADAEVGDATTVIFVYERLLTPNVGLEFVLGIPPTLTAKATGSVAFLGDVLTAKNVAPTLFLNYHFFGPDSAWRPYVGAGINYTHFTDIHSTLAPDVQMGNSTGLALQAGINYAITKDVGVFASIAKVDVKSKLVATGASVLQTTVDFRPIVYTAGVSYQF
jgi:outer membrane protein